MDFLGLNITLNSYLKNEIKFDPNVNVDKSVRQYRKSLHDFLVVQGISSDILNVIFIKDISLEKSMTDSEYLEVMKKGLQDENISKVARMYLDFYVIEHALRRSSILKIEGGHLYQFIKRENDSLESVLLKSNYYKWMGLIKLENYRKLFDEYLYRSLKETQYVNIGLEGIISRVVRNLLLMDNFAIIEKAQRMHLDARDIVRSYDE